MLYYIILFLFIVIAWKLLEVLFPYLPFIIGIVLLHHYRKKLFPFLYGREESNSSYSDEERPRYRSSGTYSRNNFSNLDNQAEKQFLMTMSSMMAKMAKASGYIAQAEINSAEAVFRRLVLSDEQRKFCIDCFHEALKNNRSIYQYAAEFTQVQPDSNIREILYAIMWDIAIADGVLQDVELQILRHLTIDLQIRQTLFSWHFIHHNLNNQNRRRNGSWKYYGRSDSQGEFNGGNSSRSGANYGRYQMSEDDPYAILDCLPNTSNDEVKKAFRQKAKNNHPDVLVLKGVPREKANEQMARINAAWDQIRKERGL